MPDEQIHIDIEARDRARDTIDDVADAARDLEKREVEIPVSVLARDGRSRRDLVDANSSRAGLRRSRSLIPAGSP